MGGSSGLDPVEMHPDFVVLKTTGRLDEMVTTLGYVDHAAVGL